MTQIKVQTTVAYDVNIGEGVASAAPQFMRDALGRARKAALVTDSNEIGRASCRERV